MKRDRHHSQVRSIMLAMPDTIAQPVCGRVHAASAHFLACSFLSFEILLQAVYVIDAGTDLHERACIARRLNPQLTIKWLMPETPTPSIVIDGLRKAGLPEE